MNVTTPLYLIPGWGFSSNVFKCPSFPQLSWQGLDYFDTPNPSLESTSHHLAKRISKPSILVGWSFGGLLAIKMAHLFPEKVKKLILIGSQPRFLEDKTWTGICKETADTFLQHANKNLETLISYFLKLTNYPNYRSSHKNHLTKNLAKTSKENLIKQLKTMLHTDLRQEYQSINKQILQFIGDKDSIIKQDPTSLKKLNPNTQIAFIEQAGHASFLTHSNTYQNTLRSFIDDN